MNSFILDRIEATRLYQSIRARMNNGLVVFLARGLDPDEKPWKVAEVACGSGFAAHLLAQNQDVQLSVAADINLDDYRQAHIVDFGARFVLMDLFRPALQRGSFDLVWNSSSVEELDHPLEAVQYMAWLAKPGGKIFVGVPNRHGIAGFLRVVPSVSLRRWLGRVYDRGTLRSLLKAAGLEVEKELTYLGGTFLGMLATKPR